MLTFPELTTMEEFDHVVNLQQTVWSMSPDHANPNHTLKAVVHSGGSVIGADMDGRIVGFALALIARRDNEYYVWSDMAGVDPHYQGLGVGWGLKQAQRQWALKHGFEVIRWTFDPLQRGNANFNLNKLGAYSDTYHINFYGNMGDTINMGLPSDRLEITWRLIDSRVIALAAGKTTPTSAKDDDEGAFLVKDHMLNIPEAPLDHTQYFVEIPYDLKALKQSQMEMAIRWQKSVRDAMMRAFDQGYCAVDFANQENRCWYILERRLG
jgi:predicted GNAT superfamily acetyltransferase